MSTSMILTGFLFLFLLYQLAEASAQGLLDLPGNPYTFFILFVLVIPAADLIARWQASTGLSAYGMGFHMGWCQNYLFGLGLGVTVRAIFEWIGIRLSIRRVSRVIFQIRSLLTGFVWILFANFPAAAAEDLITRGYPWRFMQEFPLPAFLFFSALLYTINHTVRIFTRPITDWYHLPFLGLTLAYALFRFHSLWFVIGLHQAGNVVYYMMQQTMKIDNTTDTKKRVAFGVLGELALSFVILMAGPLA